MKLVNGKYSSVVQENGKPVNISFTAKFIDIFEHDKRWFARVSPLANSMATLNRVYAVANKRYTIPSSSRSPTDTNVSNVTCLSTAWRPACTNCVKTTLSIVT